MVMDFLAGWLRVLRVEALSKSGIASAEIAAAEVDFKNFLRLVFMFLRG